MCGIIAIAGKDNIVNKILMGLKRLEYRGYDSAGIGVQTGKNIHVRRSIGKIKNLGELLEKEPINGATGIGHTRWATHGSPTLQNTHPHSSKDVSIVHNGIIENYLALKQELKDIGVTFQSETDSEVICHLLSFYLSQELSPLEALKKTVTRLEGSFAIACLLKAHEGLILGVRRGCPLVIGLGEEENYLGSDALALLDYTQKIHYLDDDDIALIHHDEVRVLDRHLRPKKLNIQVIDRGNFAYDKGNFSHFMLKEIFEQPHVIKATLTEYLARQNNQIHLPPLPIPAKKITHLHIVACGTSYYAGLVAKYWLEELARIPVNVEIASEFRYRHPVLLDGTLSLFISQSGETADTIAALRFVKEAHHKTMAIVNVPTSTMAREADSCILTKAGVEIGVASTKAFTGHLMALFLFALDLASKRGTLSPSFMAASIEEIYQLPEKVEQTLALGKECQRMADTLKSAKSLLFLGRGLNYPIALEGALKTKELSYIHSEGFAGGEIKHGPIALIEPAVPTVIIAPSNHLHSKIASNMNEILGRGGPVFLLSDLPLLLDHFNEHFHSLIVPKIAPLLTPFIYILPLQLLAFHISLLLERDIDQPRNLAKSVTVE